MAANTRFKLGLSRAALIGAISLSSVSMMAPMAASGQQGTFLPSGQYVTPNAVPNANFQALNPNIAGLNVVAGGAVSTALSPDNKTLAVLTCGYNSWTTPTGSVNDEYIFLYDVSGYFPVQIQVLTLPNTFVGIIFSIDGKTLYVGGGKDDSIHTFKVKGGLWTEFGKPIKLGYKTANGLYPGDYPPMTGGLALTGDGTILAVANYSNDSVSFISTSTRAVLSSFDLRPGIINPSQSGVPGGEYPFWISIKGNNTAYISCARDREIDVVDFSTPTAPTLTTRIAVQGNPLKSALDAGQAYLYVAEDNSDLVDIISTSSNTLFQSVVASGPATPTFANALKYKGSAPCCPALSADGSTLYVTLAGANAVSVIQGIPYHPVVVGLIPTGYVPSSITLSFDGTWAYVADAKGVTGPNPGETYYNGQPNNYVYQLQKSYLHSFPIPNSTDLATLTAQVAQNNFYGSTLTPAQQAVLSFLQAHIKHVIYLEKENRTYDQILGDLPIGNGDPSLTDFGTAVTPNYHTIAQQFVDLDNFYNTGDVSGDGQIWSVAGRENYLSFIDIPGNYSGRGEPYDSEGQNRDINMAFATSAERQVWLPESPSDPNILPGTLDVGAVDGPGVGNQQRGYLWDVVLRAGLTFRNYGYHCDQAEYFAKPPTPLLLNPRATKTRVAFPSRTTLLKITDPYFRSFDNNFPDYYREQEWEFEFKGYVKNNNLPAISMVRLMHDHMGSFGTAILGVNTPEYQQADNDYAVAKLIEKVANSQYASDTLIFILEDDSQNGADHVDSHRSTGYIVGPYVARGVVVSTPYTTQNMLATIEAILGLDHEDILTASEMPMLDCFDVTQGQWTFNAVPSAYLYNTQLPLPPRPKFAGRIPKATHNAKYWAQVTKGFDFTREDDLKDPNKFNQIIWEGLHGKNVPYPVVRTGTKAARRTASRSRNRNCGGCRNCGTNWRKNPIRRLG
jgi:DNA-binding beta-propeller fold protein YncE